MSYAKYKDLGSKNDTKPVSSKKRPSISENYKPRQQSTNSQMASTPANRSQLGLQSGQTMMGAPQMMSSPQQQMSQPMMMGSPQPMMTQPMTQPMMMGSPQPVMNHQPVQPMMVPQQPIPQQPIPQQPIPQQPIPQQQLVSGTGGSYKISSDADKNNLIASNKLAVVYVWGTFCGPCKQIAPVYEELANKHNNPGSVILAKEDVALKITPNIRGVPTFQFFLNGKLVDQIVGADTVSLSNKIVQYSN